MTASPQRHLIGYGFRDQPIGRWTWHCLQMMLGLTTDIDVFLRWGADSANPPGPAFSVNRDPGWTPTVERLRADLQRLSTLRADDVPPLSHLDVDVVSWTAWLLSRAEEYGAPLDHHGRYVREDAIISRAGLSHEPVVDTMVATLRRLLVRYVRHQGIEVREHHPWPDGKRFAVWLSHDVDHAEPRSIPLAARKLVGAALSKQKDTRARRLGEARELVRGGSANPYWQIDNLRRISEEVGSPGTYFMLPHTSRIVFEGRRRVRRYDIRRPEVVLLMDRLQAAGAEVGLHLTYDSHDQPHGIDDDLEVFVRTGTAAANPPGARAHYLRFTVPETWRREEEAGLLYDSTLGWTSGWGYRSGSSVPFRPYDRDAHRPLGLWELEVNLMDVAVTPGEFLPAVHELLARGSEARGCVGVLLHPTPWGGRSVAEHLELYRSVLESLSSPDIWLTTASAIVAAMEHYERAVTSPYPHACEQGRPGRE